MNKYLLTLTMCLVAAGNRVYASSTAPIAPIPTPFSTVSAPVDPDHFTFICTGDNRPPAAGDPIMPVCVEICKEIGLIRPDFVFWTGDCIYGYKDSQQEASKEYDGFLKTATLCGVPVFNAVGNHEITDDPALTPLYVRRMGALYGSMDYGNSHFISLNTDPIVDGAVQEGVLDPVQLQWLQADLAANQKAANVFVFMHHYVYGPPDPETVDGPDTGFASVQQRDQLHKLFVQYGVRAVFCGHDHLFWHAARDGVDYYISGNAGAPLDAGPEDVDFGYLLVAVNGPTFTATERAANTLASRLVSGGNGKAPTAVVEIDAPDIAKITVSGIVVKMPAQKNYVVAAFAKYKGKTKPVAASIAEIRPSGTDGVSYVRITASLPGSRTTTVTVSAD